MQSHLFKLLLLLVFCSFVSFSCSSGNVDTDGDQDIMDVEQEELDLSENDVDESELSDGDWPEGIDSDDTKPDGDEPEADPENFDIDPEDSTDGDDDEAEIAEQKQCTPETECCTDQGYFEEDGTACTADELSCTEDACDVDGVCRHNLSSGYCLVEGECYQNDQQHPDNSCVYCNSGLLDNGWSNHSTGFDCDDDEPCTYEDKCDVSANCSGTVYSCSGEYGTCNGDGTCSCVNEYMNADCSACLEHYTGYPDCTWDGTSYPKDFCSFNICTPVPPTGQTSCHDDDNVLSSCVGEASSATCGSTDYCGQDAQYTHNERTFTCYNSSGVETACSELATASDNEVVKDSLTGLTWQRTYKSNITWLAAKTYCENLEYAGYEDWRLPTAHELSGIVNGQENLPCIDKEAFPGFVAEWLWGLTSYAGDTDKAWTLIFNYGSIYFYDKTESKSTFCVRSDTDYVTTAKTDSDYDRFVMSDDEKIITDLVTGLQWNNLSPSLKTWKQALALCESMDYGGYDDWRLPDRNELASLIDYEMVDPASEIPGGDSSTYWSSTSRADDSMHAWVVSFKLGSTGLGNKPNSFSARCVRGGP